jgi:hypothetical protein
VFYAATGQPGLLRWLWECGCRGGDTGALLVLGLHHCTPWDSMRNFVHVQFVADICRSEGSRRMSSLLGDLLQYPYFPNDDFSCSNDLGKLSDQTTHYWAQESIHRGRNQTLRLSIIRSREKNYPNPFPQLCYLIFKIHKY